jgi:hypothetical protein
MAAMRPRFSVLVCFAQPIKPTIASMTPINMAGRNKAEK